MATAQNLSVCSCDWYSRAAVVQLAIYLGPGLTVIQYPDRMDFNIIFTELEKKLPHGTSVIYRTKGA